MQPRFWIALILLAVPTSAQPNAPLNDFSITLERIGCVGNCPDYKVTILADGSVRYEGRAYVRCEGTRTKTIKTEKVAKLARQLLDKGFLDWQEKHTVCLDFAEVHVTATLNGRRKHVVEGCNEAGQILKLADEIDKVSGARDWVR